MKDIISKIESVKISNVDRISERDKSYCENQQRMYEIAILALSNFLNEIRKIYTESDKEVDDYSIKGFIDEYKDIRHIESRIAEIKERFIYKICSYFRSAYKVSVDDDSIKKKYKSLDVSYAGVVDEIFIQLGGFSFREKAVNEIKSKFLNMVTRHRGGSCASKKNCKVTLESTYIIRYDSIFGRYEIGYQGEENASKLFKALSYYEYGGLDVHWKFSNFYFGRDRGAAIFNKCELQGFEKIRSIKMFKNGRVDIEFTSSIYANQFAKEYCGYVQEVA